MTGPPGIYLLLHGAIVVLAGLISGIPYWTAIIRNKDKVVIQVWRIAHSFLVMDGIFMLVAGLAVPYCALGGQAVLGLVWSLILAGYGFVWAFVVGALKGVRGLTVKPYGLNTVIFIGHLVGASGSLAGTIILIVGFLKTI